MSGFSQINLESESSSEDNDSDSSGIDEPDQVPAETTPGPSRGKRNVTWYVMYTILPQIIKYSANENY